MTDNQGTDPRISALVDSLHGLTSQGKIHWAKAGSRRAEPFSVNLTNGTVRILSADGDELAPYVIQILDGGGIVIQRITEGSFPVPDRQHFRTAIAEIYSMARYQALNVDSVLDSIMTDLRDEDASEQTSHDEE